MLKTFGGICWDLPGSGGKFFRRIKRILVRVCKPFSRDNGTMILWKDWFSVNSSGDTYIRPDEPMRKIVDLLV